MIKKFVILTVLGALLTITTGAFAEKVFMTQRGKKYHKAICRLIKNKENTHFLEKEEAIEKGYTPCKRCFKEDIVVEAQGKGEVKTQK